MTQISSSDSFYADPDYLMDSYGISKPHGVSPTVTISAIYLLFLAAQGCPDMILILRWDARFVPVIVDLKDAPPRGFVKTPDNNICIFSPPCYLNGSLFHPTSFLKLPHSLFDTADLK